MTEVLLLCHEDEEDQPLFLATANTLLCIELTRTCIKEQSFIMVGATQRNFRSSATTLSCVSRPKFKVIGLLLIVAQNRAQLTLFLNKYIHMDCT